MFNRMTHIPPRKSYYAGEVYRLLLITIFILASKIFLTGCEYDVAEPQWDKHYTEPPQTTVTQIEPEAAVAGVNIITIQGGNFNGVSITQGVLFNTVFTEVVENTGTTLRVRRPNLVSENATVKIISTSLIEAKKGPYRIDPVLEQYGSFVDNLQLAVVAVDPDENLYVIESSSRTIHKVSPNGNKTIIGETSRSPTEAVFAPDGNLYLLSNNRRIEKIDISTGEITEWTQLPQGRIAKLGDFDNEYLYTGGLRTDVFVVPFNDPGSATLSGFYSSEEVLAVRIYEGYLYVVSRVSIDPAKIWKHQIQNGTLSGQELVLDMSTVDSVLSSRLIKAITFSSNGTIYLATDDPDPLLVLDPVTSKIDIFYKGIIPPYCKYFNWGTESYLYMLIGNQDPVQEWNVYRVDIGSTGIQ